LISEERLTIPISAETAIHNHMLVNPSSSYWLKRISKKAAHELHNIVIGDKRCRFYDLSKIEPRKRVAQSPIIQFYSSADNIGNFLPVLGIRDMLGTTPDTWCVQDQKIDFEFINKNYKCAIIGGAGLLVSGQNEVFEHFWHAFSKQCYLPTMIWGVGTDGPNKPSSFYYKVVSEFARRCDLVNVRDDFTANVFDLVNAEITACPTLVYLDKIKKESKNFSKNPEKVTLVHYMMQSDKDLAVKEIHKILDHNFSQYSRIINYQYSYMGLNDIIANYYLKSNFIVTTMLHGAISAYSLGVPYVAISKTVKIQSFFSQFGSGFSISKPEELKELLQAGEITRKVLEPTAINPVLAFGEKARAWIDSIC
jgi:hypothetical protein